MQALCRRLGGQRKEKGPGVTRSLGRRQTRTIVTRVPVGNVTSHAGLDALPPCVNFAGW